MRHWRNRALLALRATWRRAWGLLPAGALPFRVRIAAALRAVLGQPTGQAPRELDAAGYARWIARNDTLDAADHRAIAAHIAALAARPVISLIMILGDPPEPALRAAIDSIHTQIYPHWELSVVERSAPSAPIGAILAVAAAADPRIRIIRLDSGDDMASVANDALAQVSGDFVAFLDARGRLATRALYEVAAEIAAHPDAAVIYSDEDRIDAEGQRVDPHFKPDFDADLLLGQDFLGDFRVWRRETLVALGGLRAGFEDGGAHDLALRATHACGAARVRHIPSVLHHGHAAHPIPPSRRAVAEALAEREVAATLEPARLAPGHLRVLWPVPHPAPLVSVIVPTRDRPALLGACAEGVLNGTDYRNLELIVMDNGSAEAETMVLFERLRADPRVRILRDDAPFNYARLNNRGAREARGDILLLLNNDIEVIDPAWLHELVAQASRPDVGAVGAKLLYGDGTVQHGGVVTGAGGIAAHYGTGAARDDPGPHGTLALVREVSAVTGACLALRRAVYQSVGGLDEVHLAVAYNDVELCLKIGERGLRILWTPFAELHHLESRSRGFDVSRAKAARFLAEVRHMRQRWDIDRRADPFFNPNLDLGDPTGALATVSRRVRPWRVPGDGSGAG